MTVLLVFVAAFFSPEGAPEAKQMFVVGEQLYAEGKYKLAADTLARAAAIFEQLNQRVEQVKSANLQAECLSNLGQCDVAGALLQRSLEIISNQKDRATLADTYYYLSRHAGGCARKFDDAIKLMQKSIDIKKVIYKTDDPSIAFDYTFLGYVYNSKGKYDSALMYLDQAMKLRSAKPDDIETSHTLFNLAASYEGKSDLGKALSTNLRSLEIRTTALGDSHATVSNSINSIGRIYRKLGNVDRALEYYRKALDTRKTTLGENHPNVAASYYEIGNLYGTISNYHSALEYVLQGNRILENNTQVASDVLPSYIAYAGKMYELIGDHENAKTHIQKAIAVAEKSLPASHPYRAIVYNIVGEYFGEVGDINKQSEFFKKATVIYQSSYGVGSEREADAIAKLAATNAKLNRPAEALRLYSDALMIYYKKLGSPHPKVAGIHLGIGDVYAGVKDLRKSAKAYQFAMESVDVETNKSLALKIARSQARIGTSLAAYQKALELMDDLSQDYNNEAARIQLEKERRELFVEAMNLAWKLYDSTRDQSIVQKTFALSEKSKVNILLENMQDQRAKTIAGIPDEMINDERDLQVALAYYKTNLYQSKQKGDTTARRVFEKNIFDTARKLELLKSKMEKDFPAYYQLKYTRPTVDLITVQKQLPGRTNLLEYFVSDSAIYCFRIFRGLAEFKRQPIDQKFKDAVNGYQKSLTDARFIVNDPTSADSLYKSTARTLFSLLMVTESTRTDAQRLVIIPDDFLAQFNFGTLLYEDVKDNNYTTFPYLNNKYIVSYAYSAGLLEEREDKTRGKDFAGFAPSYELNDYSSIDSVIHPMTALAVRSGNLPLPGATQEVHLISDLMSGKSWTNEDATETNFKKYSGDYDVLHLAMHSLLNDEDPRYSELLFNNRNDKENDGYLTIAEIYNLKLDAQLVVLSACSSGSGKIQHGEGPISLSRAFSYAGCPSVVMSLWKVPDRITTEVMKNFYENLSAGMDKDEALRAAQLKFQAENTDPLYRHPYYWAGFVVIGDTSKLESSPPYKAYGYIILGVLVVAVASFEFFKKR
jgi:CHAT domain-containing protein